MQDATESEEMCGVEAVHLAVSIAGHLEYFVLTVVRQLQAVLAWIPSSLVKLMIWDTKNSFVREEGARKIFRTKAGRETQSELTLDALFWRHRLWNGKPGRLLFKLQTFLRNDCVDGELFYRHLVEASVGSKHTGFVKGELVAGIECLGTQTAHGTLWDIRWLNNIDVAGAFVLVGHELRGASVVCRCVWLTGENAGRAFYVSREHRGTLESFISEGKNPHAAAGVYIPPKIVRVVWSSAKTIIGVAAIVGAIKVIIDFFKWVV